jgi:hypothetical protein
MRLLATDHPQIALVAAMISATKHPTLRSASETPKYPQQF